MVYIYIYVYISQLQPLIRDAINKLIGWIKFMKYIFLVYEKKNEIFLFNPLIYSISF